MAVRTVGRRGRWTCTRGVCCGHKRPDSGLLDTREQRKTIPYNRHTPPSPEAGPPSFFAVRYRRLERASPRVRAPCAHAFTKNPAVAIESMLRVCAVSRGNPAHETRYADSTLHIRLSLDVRATTAGARARRGPCAASAACRIPRRFELASAFVHPAQPPAAPLT